MTAEPREIKVFYTSTPNTVEVDCPCGCNVRLSLSLSSILTSIGFNLDHAAALQQSEGKTT